MLPALAACSGYDDVNIYMESPEDQMHLTPSAEELVLEADKANETGLTLTWGEAPSRGEAVTTTYHFRIGLADNISNMPLEEVTEHSMSYTVDDLNDMLQAWGVTPGTTVEVTAEVIAKFTDELKYHMPEVSKVTMLMTGFRPVSRPMWIVNPAKDPEWNLWCGAMSENEMNEVVLSKKWSWTGWFESSKPAKLVSDKEGTQVVTTVQVPKDGYYTITYTGKTDTMETSLLVPWNACFLVGNALPCGWDINNPVQLLPDPERPEVFVWEGEVTAGGEMKGYWATGNWNNDAFMPPVSGTDWDGDDTIVVIPGAQPDNKWIPSRGGKCRIEMNLNLMKIKFIWL